MKDFYTDINLKQNQLLNIIPHIVSSFPSGAREGQIVYNSTKKSFCFCINDTIDTTLEIAWSCYSLITTPIGIQDLSCPPSTEINDIVYISGDYEVTPAQANIFSTSKGFGFVISKESTTKCTISNFGILGNFTGLSAGNTYFISTSFAGGITDVIPGATEIVCRVGQVLSSTDLFIQIDQSLTIRS